MLPLSGSLPVLAILALGPSTGIGQTSGGWILPEFLCYHFKSKDTMAARFWGEMKQSMPA